MDADAMTVTLGGEDVPVTARESNILYKLLSYPIGSEAFYDKMVETTGAKSTDVQHSEDVNDLTAKTIKAAENWAPVADELWKYSGHCAACGKKP